MSIAQLVRQMDSIKRVQKEKAKEQAEYDYILADLIGKSVSRLVSKNASYPKINEVYPSLFDNEKIEDKIQEQKDQLSALRFRQFASYINKHRRCEDSNE